MTFNEILEKERQQRLSKLSAKLPSWSELGIEIPSSLALEQCSSQLSAAYKARVAREFVGAELTRIVDITGGLGVDSAAFATVARKVLYFERNAELAQAVERNAGKLGIRNMEFRCEEVSLQTDLPHADMIYADPARRDAVGKKLFRLAVCTPDVLNLLPLLWERTDCVMLKLSPMADVTLVARELGSELRELHLVSVGSELKELLCLLRRGTSGEYKIKVVQLEGASRDDAKGLSGVAGSFEFHPEEEKEAVAELAQELRQGDIVLDPIAALKKSGAYKLICPRLGVEKLDKSTHLYLSTQVIESNLFRRFVVMEVLAFNKANFKFIAAAYPRAEVSAHNIPMTSDELRAKLKIKSGGDIHIFGCSSCGTRLLLVCKSLPRH